MASSGMLVFLRTVCRLLVAASVVPSSPILVTLMKEAPSSSETSALTRAALTSQKTPGRLVSISGEGLLYVISTNCFSSCKLLITPSLV
jgi:hypothetical protein